MTPNILTRTLKNSLSPILEFVFPPICIHCKKLNESSSKYLCETCLSAIPKVTQQHPLYRETYQKLTESQLISELYSIYVFEKGGVFQTIAHSMKYEGRRMIGKWLGESIGRELQNKSVHADVIIPIPLHKIKLRERGYNQAEFISRGITSITSIPTFTDYLKRVKHTQTQTTLSIDERRKNMESAFDVRSKKKGDLKKKVCILVDDIVTTGSTILSSAEELKKAGAKKIIVASAALAE